MAKLAPVWLSALAVVALGSASASGAHRSTSCPVTHVHYGTDTSTADKGLRGIPWVASAPNGAIRGTLFFYGAMPWNNERLIGARIFTNASHLNVNPKVLWRTRARGYSRAISIRGARLDAPGSFNASYPGWGDYPSYVQVPTAGCWRVIVKTGKVSGRFVFLAIDQP